jgi:glutamate-1-semialdehyde 2,1-aminomutase
MTYLTLEDVNTEFKALIELQQIKQDNGILFNGGYEENNFVLMDSAKGPYMHDIEGRKYIDTGMGAGSMILGHAHKSIVDKISMQASKGSIFVHPTKNAYKLKENILEILPEKFTGVIFSSSGSEATLRAIRLARASSGKNGIALFSGGWHGSHDLVLAGDDYSTPESSPRTIPLSAGIPKHLHDDVVMLPYNDQQAFNIIQQHAQRLALVIIEPIQGSNPRSDIVPFLKQLSETCIENRVLLAFDEIITGYRLSLSGAIGCFGIFPDIITYGKILGGGLPLGAVVFDKKIASEVFGGNKPSFFTGGTFSANPLTMGAGIEVLKCLKTKDYRNINVLSEKMRETCNTFFTENEYPLQMIGYNSISRIIFTDQKVLNRRTRDLYELPSSTQAIFRKLMILNGVLHPSNGIVFLSFSHEPCHVEKIVQTIKDVVKIMDNVGCFNKHLVKN